MRRDAPEPTRQEIIEFILTSVPTDPEALVWKGLLGTRRYLRLRMNATVANASEDLIEAYRTLRYPEEDIPEIRGLLRVLEESCGRAGVPFRLEPGTRDLVEGVVGYFEPRKIRLPFANATLALTIAPGEFQWVLKGGRKERGPDATRLETLKRELLSRTREWVRNGNRYEGSLFR